MVTGTGCSSPELTLVLLISVEEGAKSRSAGLRPVLFWPSENQMLKLLCSNAGTKQM
jgi:hypothetical protein